MKLVHKIILGNVLTIIFIALTYGFFYQKFEVVLTKLRFVEIADSLNASFLNMRLSEKNYFLYKDKSSLSLIRSELVESDHEVENYKVDITRAVGAGNFKKLKLSLNRYEQEVEKIGFHDKNSEDVEATIREAGRELRLLSEKMVTLERRNVNHIISNSRDQLFYFFCLVLFVAITTTYLFFSKMFRSLREIEKTANSISEGNFQKIEGKISEDELGSVMAAINSMCGELTTRHEELIQSKKLASLGVLTAGVAHELGNPLNNISMVAQTYLELYDHLNRNDRIEYMQTVLEESERIKKIVQDLLDFSKPKEADFKITDINRVIRNSLRLVQNMLHVSGIDSQPDLHEGLPPVFIDENKIQEVFVNLFTNATHAMPSGGTIYIRTSLGEQQDQIIIEVEDTGCGIPSEFLSNIFDPFFSTKGTRGSGLGLSVSYGIIRKHNGKIDVKSELGRGTRFIIQLPIHKTEESGDDQPQNHGD